MFDNSYKVVLYICTGNIAVLETQGTTICIVICFGIVILHEYPEKDTTAFSMLECHTMSDIDIC